MIIAIKKDNEITVGHSICDSSANMTEKDLSLSDNLPFWKVKGEKDCYVVTDDVNRASDILMFNDYVFRGITDGKSVIENVLPKLKKLLDKNNQIIKGKEWPNILLIIKGDKLFKINNYFCVNEIDDYTAVYCEGLVLGTLDSTAELEPTERILRAVRLVDRMRGKQTFPISIFSTKTKRKKVYYK